MSHPAFNPFENGHMGRPPHGLRPEFAHESEANCKRIREITEALLRYAAEGKTPPVEWYQELARRGGIPVDNVSTWEGPKQMDPWGNEL